MQADVDYVGGRLINDDDDDDNDDDNDDDDDDGSDDDDYNNNNNNNNNDDDDDDVDSEDGSYVEDGDNDGDLDIFVHFRSCPTEW